MHNLFTRLAWSMVFMMAISLPQISHASDMQETNLNALVVKRMGIDYIQGAANPELCNELPKDVLKIIFKEASEMGLHPGKLSRLSRHWYKEIRGSELSNTSPDIITHSAFMQSCMELYDYGVFKRGSLVYTDPDTQEVQTFPISAFKNPLNSVFDLSTCGGTHQDLRIVTSHDEFFKVKGENKDKVVILVATRNAVNNDKRLSAVHDKWSNGVELGLFWRWGDSGELSWIDYLVSSSAWQMSNVNLHDNWQGACLKYPVPCLFGVGTRMEAMLTCFHVSFLNSSKDD